MGRGRGEGEGNASKGHKGHCSARLSARQVFAGPRRVATLIVLTTLGLVHSIIQFRKNNDIGYGVTANITASQSYGLIAVARGSIPRIRISFVPVASSCASCHIHKHIYALDSDE
jgi:hypothetical protein